MKKKCLYRKIAGYPHHLFLGQLRELCVQCFHFKFEGIQFFLSLYDVSLLYEAGVDPLIAMKIIGHSDYQTTANVYTHIRDEMLKKSTVNVAEVFRGRVE